MANNLEKHPFSPACVLMGWLVNDVYSIAIPMPPSSQIISPNEINERILLGNPSPFHTGRIWFQLATHVRQLPIATATPLSQLGKVDEWIMLELVLAIIRTIVTLQAQTVSVPRKSHDVLLEHHVIVSMRSVDLASQQEQLPRMWQPHMKLLGRVGEPCNLHVIRERKSGKPRRE